MKYLERGLGGVIVFCIAIRIAAWLIEPLWPLIIVLAVLLGLYRLLSGQSFRR